MLYKTGAWLHNNIVNEYSSSLGVVTYVSFNDISILCEVNFVEDVVLCVMWMHL